MERKIRETKREPVRVDAAIEASDDDSLRGCFGQTMIKTSVILKRQEKGLEDFLHQTANKGFCTKTIIALGQTGAKISMGRQGAPPCPRWSRQTIAFCSSQSKPMRSSGLYQKGQDRTCSCNLGSGTSTTLRAADRLSHQYGGEILKWQKKTGIILI